MYMLTHTFILNPQMYRKFEKCKIRKISNMEKVPLHLHKGVGLYMREWTVYVTKSMMETHGAPFTDMY